MPALRAPARKLPLGTSYAFMALEIPLANLLQQSLQALRAGRLESAQATLAEVLRRQAEQPDALQMLAEVAYARRQPAEAAALLQRALRVSPERAAAWARLGEAQEDLGQWSEAELSYRQAASLEPAFVQALYNQARVLHRLGRSAEAGPVLNQALGLAAAAPALRSRMLQLRAQLDAAAGHLAQALEAITEALRLEPRGGALHHTRGVLLQRLARPAEALQAYEAALALGVDAADAHYNRGNSLQSLGRTGEALAAYRAALAREPLHELALYDSARLRWRLGDPDFCQELDAAAAAAPQSPLSPALKGRLLLRGERYAEAALAFDRAAVLGSGAAGHYDGLGQALARLGRFDEALAAHRRAVELAPTQAATHIAFAASLLQAGQPERAAQVAETAVRLAPLDQQAWAFLGLAWRANGDQREAWLNDYRRHVQVFDLPPPEGWADSATFCRALAAALEQMHTDAQAPIDQTLRHGSQTLGNLFDSPHPLVRQLQGLIGRAVDRYVALLAELPPDDAHPLRARVARRWRYTDSWSSRLRSGGFHTHHVHAHGWVSSCFYVALPPVVEAGGDPGHPDAGCIAFGVPDIPVPGIDAAARRVERPAVGRLVLFPSFMWHGTVPFVDDQPRLTVAFDLVPEA